MPVGATPGETSRLWVQVPLVGGAASVARALGPHAASWLGEPLAPGTGPDGPRSDMERTGSRRRFATDLRLRVSDRSERTLFRKAATVELGDPVERDGIVAVDIEWRAATLAPLFPVFSGRLTVSDGRATIRGAYAPPGGAMGRLIDAAVLHIAAEGTARWVLRELAAAVTR